MLNRHESSLYLAAGAGFALIMNACNPGDPEPAQPTPAPPIADEYVSEATFDHAHGDSPEVIERTCATDDLLALQLQADPDMAARMEAIEEHTRAHQNILSATSGSTIIIPTIVHVLYNNGTENISDAQIQSQLEVMTADFRRMNADADNTWPQAADTDIEFCLVAITRTPTSVTEFDYQADDIKFTAAGGRDVYRPAEYLNMWVGDISGGILGYAQFPGGAAVTDGVVMDYQYFGTIGTATAPYDLGRTTTHEIGHWLNLRHIWGDGGCGVDDGVSDTPPSDGSNFGCAVGHDSCSDPNNDPDMVQNYMDYSDDSCMNLFTAGQAARMQALFGAGGVRESLVAASCDLVELTCNDNQDNDGDGMTDCNDSDCAGSCPETCDDGMDNDADGDVDCFDDECTNSPACVEVCDDNVDNDGDGATDCADSGCASDPICIEVCDDGVDNDVDGATDCDDSDCANDFACVVCGTDSSVNFSLIFDNYPTETSWQLTDAMGGLITAGSNYNGGSPDVDVDLILPDGGYYLTVNDSFGDGVCCEYGMGSYALTTGVNETLASGAEFGTSETTAFCIDTPDPEVCDDGADNDDDGATDCDDPDCTGHPACPLPVEVCDDGMDNDADGDTDCDDPDCDGDPACAPPPPEVCFDNADNDGDGAIDCDDSDCHRFLFCWFMNN